jgi:hypothetical protein
LDFTDEDPDSATTEKHHGKTPKTYLPGSQVRLKEGGDARNPKNHWEPSRREPALGGNHGSIIRISGERVTQKGQSANP